MSAVMNRETPKVGVKKNQKKNVASSNGLDLLSEVPFVDTAMPLISGNTYTKNLMLCAQGMSF